MRNRALRRSNTIKWKKKRKTHFADRCNRPHCGICHPYKRFNIRTIKEIEFLKRAKSEVKEI